MSTLANAEPVPGLPLLLTLRTLTGTLWGALLVVGSAAAPVWTPHVVAIAPEIAALVMVSGVAAGQFVFCALVADRLFPRVHPALRGVVELSAGVCMLLGPALIGLILMTEVSG